MGLHYSEPSNQSKTLCLKMVWPSQARAWLAVAILLIANAISFVDRQVINLLTESIKADLGISDTAIGLLQGVAFGVFYTLLGLPLGRLSDRFNRRNIILVGVTVWSFATVSCGLARSFSSLFLARIGVGAGESTLSPAALSMISDIFPPERRALPMSVYMTGTSLGGGIALLVGGAIIAVVTNAGPVTLPAIGQVQTWQLTFLFLGASSLLLLPLIALLREPSRKNIGTESSTSDSWSQTLRYWWQRRNLYLAHNLGLASLAVYTFGIAVWTPALMIRNFDWTPGEVGVAYGLITLICGAGGVLVGGSWSQRLRYRGYTDANWRVMRAAALGLMPLAILGPLAKQDWLFLIALCPITLLTTLPLGVAAAALQEPTPNMMRAQFTAIYLFLLNLIGLGLGPVSIGLMTDHLFASTSNLGEAMALLSIIFSPIALICLTIAHQADRKLTRE